MQEHKGYLKVVQEWVEKAENDLINAVNTIKLVQGCPTDTICFHAQQCAEKYIKAYLALKGIDFPKTHDLAQLLLLISEEDRPKLSIKEQIILTIYATVTRYPGDYEIITHTEARRAIVLAKRIRKKIRTLLPKEVFNEKHST